uniref:Ubiquitin carboxyl-terminal hydrolase n=1 Tax=Globodera pallida TaxID=36090 RepID=A0A183CBU2_GLOPA
MGHKERGGTLRGKHTNKNGGGNGKKVQSKKAKQREERTRPREKTVSPPEANPPEGEQPQKEEQVQQLHAQCQDQPSIAEVKAKNNAPMMRAPKGLPNLGNTCFFNSTMQCLLSSWPLLRHYFDIVSTPSQTVVNPAPFTARVGDKEVPKLEVHLPQDFPMPTFWAFIKLAENVHNEETKRPNPVALFDQISRKVPRFRGMAQQDAHELLHYLMNTLRQEELARFQRAFLPNQNDETDGRRLVCRALLDGPARPMLDTIYSGTLQQTITCGRCNNVSVALEPFFDLSLPVKAAASTVINGFRNKWNTAHSSADAVPSVHDALRLFTVVEVLRSDTHAYRCAKCNEQAAAAAAKKKKLDAEQQQKKEGEESSIPPPAPANALKQYQVLSPPLVLTLHLKRFEHVARSVRKFNGDVRFPLLLNLAPFCSRNVNRVRPGQHRVLYRLCGVVSHAGGMNGGHYVAYVGRYPDAEDDDVQRTDGLFEMTRMSSSTQGQKQLTTRGCQYSVNDGIISDGDGHSRRITPDEEQQLADYHAEIARATEEFQSQMMRAVAAPFKEFGQNIGQTPQLRLPEAPCAMFLLQGNLF